VVEGGFKARVELFELLVALKDLEQLLLDPAPPGWSLAAGAQ
jgi:hypothetical protein